MTFIITCWTCAGEPTVPWGTQKPSCKPPGVQNTMKGMKRASTTIWQKSLMRITYGIHLHVPEVYPTLYWYEVKVIVQSRWSNSKFENCILLCGFYHSSSYRIQRQLIWRVQGADYCSREVWAWCHLTMWLPGNGPAMTPIWYGRPSQSNGKAMERPWEGHGAMVVCLDRVSPKALRRLHVHWSNVTIHAKRFGCRPSQRQK